MPRFRPEVALTFFYLYAQHPVTGKRVGPCGTGTFVNIKSKVDGGIDHAYAVTAHHVIAGGGSIIRFNVMKPDRKGLTTQWLDFQPEEWQFIGGGDDVAAIDVTDVVGHESHFVRATRIEDFVTPKFIGEAGIVIGEDGFMVGMFTGNPGNKFNLPAVRFGNLSQLANLSNPVEQGNERKNPSHVFDMHSRPGYSGSPVFLYRTPGNDLTAIDKDGSFTVDYEKPWGSFLRLLGIHSGQFPDVLQAEGEALNVSIKVPSSMTVVVPAWAITKLLDQQVFQEQREMREEQQRQENNKPKVIPEVAPAEATEDENPHHKEDFTALLNAAVRKPKSDD